MDGADNMQANSDRNSGVGQSGVGDLTTGRLVLRPLVMEDAPGIAALMNNWNVVRTLSRPPFPYRIENARQYLANAAARMESHDKFDWAITRDGELIGGIGYGPSEIGQLIGYWLGEPYWRQGYMSEAVAAVVGQFFATQPVDALYSGIFVGNSASLRIQERLGFEVIGQSMLYCVARNENVEHVDTRLTRETYEALRS